MELTRRSTDKWHIVRGVPVAVIVAFVLQTLSLVGAGGYIAARFVSTQEKFGESLVGVRAEVAEVKGQLSSLQSAVQNNTVPSAKNEWRIEAVERRAEGNDRRIESIERTTSENSRRLSLLEANSRASRER